MTRRDTIIIAVLINAGLLIVLFASALKTDNSEHTLSAGPDLPPPQVTELTRVKDSSRNGGDEVDQVLKQYGKTETAASSQTPSTSAAPLAANTSSQKPAVPNFADDLKAIALPESPAPFASVATETTPAASAEPVKPTFSEVKVKKGDVLEKIARQNHTTVDAILKLNDLSSVQLRIGQVLRIPPKSSTVTAAKEKADEKPSPLVAPKEATPKFYVVKNGDNPWTIAVKNHMKVEELLKLNNLNEEKARRLKPGDQLRIR